MSKVSGEDRSVNKLTNKTTSTKAISSSQNLTVPFELFYNEDIAITGLNKIVIY